MDLEQQSVLGKDEVRGSERPAGSRWSIKLDAGIERVPSKKKCDTPYHHTTTRSSST